MAMQGGPMGLFSEPGMGGVGVGVSVGVMNPGFGGTPMGQHLSWDDGNGWNGDEKVPRAGSAAPRVSQELARISQPPS